MKSSKGFSVILVTAPSIRVARVLAKAVLGARLAACVNVVPRIESHYWWQGKIERAAEALCVFKTSRAKISALEKLILQEHPYDTPEIVSLPIHSGNERYLKWLADALK